MLRPLKPHEVVWRDQLRAEITKAFDHVRRGTAARGGVDIMSWAESEVVDRYGTDEERRAARLADKDTHWLQLVDDTRWQPFAGVGGWTFLAHPSYRYYIPPTMMRFLLSARASDETEDKRTRTLTRDLDSRRFADLLHEVASPPPWSPPERAAVARFVWCMERWNDASGNFPRSHNPWRQALHAWREHLVEM
jgi:hypothetical protein